MSNSCSGWIAATLVRFKNTALIGVLQDWAALHRIGFAGGEDPARRLQRHVNRKRTRKSAAPESRDRAECVVL